MTMSKPRHINILEEALATQKERGANYGGVEENFTRTAEIASAMFDADVQPWDVCMILAAVKLARTRGNKAYQDNYLDAINYIAFAAAFAQGPEQEPEEGDDGEGDDAVPDILLAPDDPADDDLGGAIASVKDYRKLPEFLRRQIEAFAAATGRRPEDVPIFINITDPEPQGTKH